MPIAEIGTTRRADPGGTDLWTLVGQITAFADEDVFLQDETGTAWIDIPEAAPANDLKLGAASRSEAIVIALRKSLLKI